MSAYEFTITGDPAVAKHTASQALEAQRFVMHWDEDWSGRGISGSKVKAAFFGAFAPYMEIGVKVMAFDGGVSIIRLDQLTSGWFSGVFGVAKTDKAFVALRDQLGHTFDQAGVLVRHGNPAAPPPSH